MAFLGATASTYAGMGFMSSGLQGIGQLIQGKQTKGAYDYNASILDQQAEASRVKTSMDEYKAKKNTEIKIGEQRAAYAGAGVKVDTGSPIDVMVDSLHNAYMDQAIEKYNNDVATARYQSEAAMSRYTGAQAKRESTFGAGMSLLQGGVTYGQKMGIK